VKALHTVTSSCSLYGQDERFDDGLTTERIKCTDVLSTGKLSNQEYSCAGSGLSVYFRHSITSNQTRQKTRNCEIEHSEHGYSETGEEIILKL